MDDIEAKNADIAGVTSRLSDDENSHFCPARRDPLGTENGQNQASWL
ncbi:hypothetical protein [Membranihabitans maritimus]|nr:hypothetical protein [Membranihabitans maritimus]